MSKQAAGQTRFSKLRLSCMFAGGDGAPKHLFPHCPHVKRMMGKTNVARVFKLGPDSLPLKLARCKWCRSLYLTLLTENTKVPAEVVQALSLVPREEGGGEYDNR